MKQWFLALLLCLLCVNPLFAVENNPNTVQYVNLFINGQEVQSESKPFIKNGKAYISIADLNKNNYARSKSGPYIFRHIKLDVSNKTYFLNVNTKNAVVYNLGLQDYNKETHLFTPTQIILASPLIQQNSKTYIPVSIFDGNDDLNITLQPNGLNINTNIINVDLARKANLSDVGDNVGYDMQRGACTTAYYLETVLDSAFLQFEITEGKNDAIEDLIKTNQNIWITNNANATEFRTGNKTCILKLSKIKVLKRLNDKELLVLHNGNGLIIPFDTEYVNYNITDGWTQREIYSARKGYYAIGMHDGVVMAVEGAPIQINKNVGSWGTDEQWVYNDCERIPSRYFYFRNGILTGMQN